MIKILKSLRKEKGLCLIVTELDAKAAGITTKPEKEIVAYHVENHLTRVSDNIENEFVLEHFKEFLVEEVFVHYVDLVGILNYIYTLKNIIKVARKHPSHSKFLFVIEFKNYICDESDSNDDNEEEEAVSFGISFKTDILKKNDLRPMEEVLLRAFNILYNNNLNILIRKPIKVNLFLKERDISKGTEELLCMNVSFCKPK
jgi:hypothetical protein